MKTKRNINESATTPTFVHSTRTWANWGTYDYGSYYSGDDMHLRVLSRSTGVWEPGSRKPEQPYQNTTYAYRVPRGTLEIVSPDTGYGLETFRLTGAVGTFVANYCGQVVPSSYGGSVGSFPPPDSLGVNPDLLSQAEVKAYNKLMALDPVKATQSPDLAVAAGERRETGRLLVAAATGVLGLAQHISGFRGSKGWEFRTSDLLQKVFGVKVHPADIRRKYQARRSSLMRQSRKGAITRGVMTATLLADMWLTYKLAYTPLMSELGSAYNAIAHDHANIDRYTFRVSARHYRQRASTDSREIASLTSVSQEFNASELHGYTVTFVASPIPEAMTKLAQFGLDNPAGTLWELTTLSFVVDYFVNVGDWLSALNAPKRYQFVDGSWTQRIVRLYSMTASGQGSKTVGYASMDHTQRHVYETFPVPMPPLSLNGEDLSLSRLITMASLAVVKLRKLLQ